MNRDYYIAQLNQDSAHKQVELFNSVFNEKKSETAWLYKHNNNPLSKQYNIFGAIDDEGIIGINGFMPMSFQIGNIVLQAVQSCDSAISIQHRGQGIFSKIITAAEKHYKDSGFDFMLGFPNHNSFPALIKVGWLHLMDIRTAILPCSITLGIRIKFKISLPNFTNNIIDLLWRNTYKIAKQHNDFEIIVLDKAPFTVDECKRINQANKFVFCKTPQLLKWKLDDNVKKDFKYYLAKKDDKLLSLLIVDEMLTKNKFKILRIVDWVDFSGNINYFKCACAQILLQMKNNADLITLWSPTERCYKDMFSTLGFITNRHYPPTIPVTLKILSNDEETSRLLRDANNWQPKLIEDDTLL